MKHEEPRCPGLLRQAGTRTRGDRAERVLQGAVLGSQSAQLGMT